MVMPGSRPLAVRAAGLAHGRGDPADLGVALLGQREGRLLVVEGGGLVTEDERRLT